MNILPIINDIAEKAFCGFILKSSFTPINDENTLIKWLKILFSQNLKYSILK